MATSKATTATWTSTIWRCCWPILASFARKARLVQNATQPSWAASGTRRRPLALLLVVAGQGGFSRCSGSEVGQEHGEIAQFDTAGVIEIGAAVEPRVALARAEG